MGDQNNSIRTGWVIVKLLLIAAFAVLFNFFPERVGIWRSALDPSSFTPILTPTFTSYYMPWLNLWWGVAFSLNITYLLLRRKTIVTHWIDPAVRIFGAFILLWMAVGDPFLAIVWETVTTRALLAIAGLATLAGVGIRFTSLLDGSVSPATERETRQPKRI